MAQTMIPAVATPHTIDEAILAFVEAWPLVIHEDRTAEAISIAIAHCCLECGNFGMDAHGVPKVPPTIYCDDVGNTRPATGEDCDVCQYPGNEIIGGRIVSFKPPDPLSTFRAFKNFAAGIAAQLTFYSHWDPDHDPHYAAAWRCLLAGDAAGFVRELKAGGYFTADEGPYERAVVSIYSRVLPAVRRVLAGLEHAITDEDRAHVAALVALTLDDVRLADTEPSPPIESEPA